MSGKTKTEIAIRSSVAEYLTFAADTGDCEWSYEMRYEDENIWLTQKNLAALYDVDIRSINYYVNKIFDDCELSREDSIRKYRMVQTEGNHLVERKTEHCNLQMIIAVGFRINNDRAVQFRKWALAAVKDYIIQGWAMDVGRLKNGGSVLTRGYFEKQLEKIREIRLSERKFHQKITDIYATALDYDKTAKATRDFYKTVEKRLHWSILGQTAPEVIVGRANAEKPNMGLADWEAAPEGKIQKYDVAIGKNYLDEGEIDSLSRIVSMYLDYAEQQASRNIPMTMADWKRRFDAFLPLGKDEILHESGRVTDEIAKAFAESEFEKYRIVQDRLYQSDFDKQLE